MEKVFWNDVASKGAILGVLMLVSHIFEQAMMLNGTLAQVGIVGIESIVVFGLYIYLLYRFAKSHSLHYTPEDGFSYGKAFGYIVAISLFASIIVGLGSYVSTHFIIGYNDYIDGVVNMYTNILSESPIPAQMAGIYEQTLEKIEEQPEPSIFATISASIWNYLLLGCLAGLIIAAIVKREPNIFGNENE